MKIMAGLVMGQILNPCWPNNRGHTETVVATEASSHNAVERNHDFLIWMVTLSSETELPRHGPLLGLSYGELFMLVGATAALIGPKDLAIIARTAGRLAGGAIGYAQLARGQFETVLQQSQARQVHTELQDAIAQVDAIRHEIRSISMINPGPLTLRLLDNLILTINIT